MKRILVLRGGALGDFIVTLPALALLRERWPDAQIEAAGNATAAQLARTRGLLDAVHSQHQARWSALFGAAPLTSEFAEWLSEFDLVLSYWPDPDETIRRRFPLRAGQQFLSATAMPRRAPAAAHYCEPLQTLGIEAQGYFCRIEAGRITLNPPDRDFRAAPERRVEDQLPCPVTIHPGSGSPQKNWPAENWLKLIAELPVPFALILGEAEFPRWSAVSSTGIQDDRSLFKPRLGDKALHLVNQPLEDLVSHFTRCELFLGHDSGISHLAAACGVKCVLLFGPTEPAMWAPPAPNVRVIRRGPDLTSISIDDVRQVVTEALADRT